MLHKLTCHFLMASEPRPIFFKSYQIFIYNNYLYTENLVSIYLFTTCPSDNYFYNAESVSKYLFQKILQSTPHPHRMVAHLAVTALALQGIVWKSMHQCAEQSPNLCRPVIQILFLTFFK